MNLTGEEREALAKSLYIIELERGCRTQCLGCGVDAPKPLGVLEYTKLEKIVEEIGRENGILCEEKTIIPFRQSDPVPYRSEGKNIAHATRLMYHSLGRIVKLTTSGWNPEGHEQEAMESLPRLGAMVYVSIKPVHPLFIGDVTRYVRQNGEVDFRSFEEHLNPFIDQSHYAKMIIANMRTLSQKNSPEAVFGSQNLDNPDWDIPEGWEPYQAFIGSNFMDAFANECRERSGVYVWVSPQERFFVGLGRAPTDMDMAPISLPSISGLWEADEPPVIFSMIDYQGKIQILLAADPYQINSALLSRDDLLQAAAHLPKDRKKYEALANVVGRPILG